MKKINKLIALVVATMMLSSVPVGACGETFDEINARIFASQPVMSQVGNGISNEIIDDNGQVLAVNYPNDIDQKCIDGIFSVDHPIFGDYCDNILENNDGGTGTGDSGGVVPVPATMYLSLSGILALIGFMLVGMMEKIRNKL